MREYLFKGKSKTTGEWIEGKLINGVGVTQGRAWIWNEDADGCINEAEVIPESVGIYTGIKDKKDKRIFEGDILYGYSGGSYHFGEVKYDDVTGGFYVSTARFDQNQYNYNSDSLAGEWEIRGSVHDPEWVEKLKGI